MATIILAGWREGLQKIALTKLQVEVVPVTFREAKENVDRLVDGEAVSLEIADRVAVDFFNRATDLGVLCRFSATGAIVHALPSKAAA